MHLGVHSKVQTNGGEIAAGFQHVAGIKPDQTKNRRHFFFLFVFEKNAYLPVFDLRKSYRLPGTLLVISDGRQWCGPTNMYVRIKA